MEGVELVRRFSAAPARIYAMWTEPDLMRRWLFANDKGILTVVEADPVEGGSFSILELNDGQEIDHFGRYLVADPPHRLSFTLDVPKHFTESTQIAIEITADGDGSRLEFHQIGIDPDKTRVFWEQMLDHLRDVLDEDDSRPAARRGLEEDGEEWVV